MCRQIDPNKQSEQKTAKNCILFSLVFCVTLFILLIILGLFFKHLAGTENSISFIDIVWRDLVDLGRNLVIPTIMILLAIAISVLLAITVSKNRKAEQVIASDKSINELLQKWEEIYNKKQEGTKNDQLARINHHR